MQLRFYLFVAFILFTAFTIGLNLGLHGVLSLENVQIVMTKSGRDSVLSRSKTKEPPDTPQLADRNEKYTKRESFYEQDNREQKDARQNQGIDSLNKIDSSKNNSAASEDVAISPHISNPLLVDNKLDDELAKIDSIVQQRIAKDIESKQLNLIDTSNQILGNGGVIPIVLLTCNRAELLEQTLGSLLTVAGVSRENILVSQDGAIKTVADVVKKNNLQLIQNTEGLRLRGGVPIDGGKRIAKHYKFSLTAVFDRFPDAPAVIIVEDDLLFSPDFYEYFKLVAPVLYHDPSSFIVSAWSDNGFKGKVKDPYALRRTDYFPGLGWLLTRKLYKTELEAKWPGEHWDHWLRSPAIHQNREIVYPQVPRTYHNGIKGTFMNLETHNKYFRDIDYNTNTKFSWEGHTDNFIQGLKVYYDLRIESMLSKCVHLTVIEDLAQLKGEIICVWIDVHPDPPFNPSEFQRISEFFGIWHEHRRGNYRGLHEFYWENNYILLLNTHELMNGMRKADIRFNKNSLNSYRSFKPAEVPTIRSNDFGKRILSDIKLANMKLDTFKAKTVGQSCDEVCRENGKECDPENLQYLNSCSKMKAVFPCTDCKESIGSEQPAYVSPDADPKYMPGLCLVNSNPIFSSCKADHPATLRFCTCH